MKFSEMCNLQVIDFVKEIDVCKKELMELCFQVVVG